MRTLYLIVVFAAIFALAFVGIVTEEIPESQLLEPVYEGINHFMAWVITGAVIGGFVGFLISQVPSLNKPKKNK